MADYTKSNASGSQAGGIYQLEYALDVLIKLTHELSRVGVETLDDVVKEDGSVSLSQLKHTVNETTNPLSDLSKNLWNTLAIWLSYLKSDSEESKQAQFILVSNGTVSDTSLVFRLGKSNKSEENIAQLAQDLRNAKSKDQEVQALINEVKLYEDSQLKKLIEKITHSITPNSSADALKLSTISHIQAPEETNKEKVYHELLGWFTHVIYEKWKDKKKAWVTRQELNNQIYAIINDHTGSKIFGTAEIELKPNAEEIKKYEEDNFLKHLKRIELEPDPIQTALHDYIKYLRTRSDLTNRGKVTIPQWSKVEQNFRDDWDGIRQEVKYTSAPEVTSLTMGRTIYYRTRNQQKKIHGNECASHMTPGLYHALANEDKVWWHPDFTPTKSDN